MTKKKTTAPGEEGKAEAASQEPAMLRSFDTGDEFTRGFVTLLARAQHDGTLTPEASQAAVVIFDVLRDALVSGDSSGVIATTARLVQTEDGRKRYTRRKGAAALEGWARVLWKWVPRIQAEKGEKHLAGFLPGLLQRYDDRALELDGDTVIEVIDQEIPDGATLNRESLATIAGSLADRCGAFGYSSGARDMFRKHMPEEVP